MFYRADLFGVKGFPIGAVYLFAAFFIAIFLLNKTKFGRYALGHRLQRGGRPAVRREDVDQLEDYDLRRVRPVLPALAGIFYAAYLHHRHSRAAATARS